jgi:hypothetical protein
MDAFEAQYISSHSIDVLLTADQRDGSTRTREHAAEITSNRACAQYGKPRPMVLWHKASRILVDHPQIFYSVMRQASSLGFGAALLERFLRNDRGWRL